MNLRVFLFLWIVATASLLCNQYSSYLRARTRYQNAHIDTFLQIVLNAGLFVFHILITPLLIKQIIKQRRNL
jgi:hypothetical protein